ncbi:MAG: class D sortase [Ruminococcus sp.]|nr:class D sortase [Ruminococcus sp.]
MSVKNNRHRHKKFDGKSFIILPIMFLFGIYIVLYIALVPSLSPIIDSASLFFSSNQKDYSTEYKNIFEPVSDDSTSQTNEQEYINIEDVQYPKYGEQFGELIIEDCGVDTKLFFGDDNVPLRYGVGIYNGSFIPGYGKTILVAGHNNTYFNGLKHAKAGQIVTIRTSYGNYKYEITKAEVKKSTDSSAYDLSADEENLIMYTCYPFDELGLTINRYFVYAKFVSGPIIETSEQEVE